MTFTKSKSKHPFNRIYERLRKRSYRRLPERQRAYLAGDRAEPEMRTSFDHISYLDGVHDALQEADKHFGVGTNR